MGIPVGIPGLSRRPRRPGRATRLLRAVAAATAAAFAAGCASHPGTRATEARDPSVALWPRLRVADHTYQPPRTAGVLTAGRLIAATDHGPDARFAGARRWTVLYSTTNAHGVQVPVSGVVLVPPGPAPRGGRPVVSWAHGTTGVADACAPSQLPDLGFDSYAREITALLRAGYAVTASDYPGLGTPGTHTYLVGADEGNAVADIVTAAHRLSPGLGGVWFAVGHSQGGQAALFASHAAHPAAGRLAGVVAVAPASHLEAMLPGVRAAHVPTELSFALYALAGLAATDPGVNLTALLGDAAGTASRILARCSVTPDPLLYGLDTERMLPLGAGALRRIGARMAGYGDPDRAPVPVPALLVQGGADQDVPPVWTDQVVARLRALGSPSVAYRTYPGADHYQVLARSLCDQLAFLAAHGGAHPAPCPP